MRDEPIQRELLLYVVVFLNTLARLSGRQKRGMVTDRDILVARNPVKLRQINASVPQACCGMHPSSPTCRLEASLCQSL